MHLLAIRGSLYPWLSEDPGSMTRWVAAPHPIIAAFLLVNFHAVGVNKDLLNKAEPCCRKAHGTVLSTGGYGIVSRYTAAYE